MAEATTALSHPTPTISIFTPASSCRNTWTYEEDFPSPYAGALVQLNRSPTIDLNCYPSGFTNDGTYGQFTVVSPALRPKGYGSSVQSVWDSTTTNTCCYSDYIFASTPVIPKPGDPYGSIYQGCFSIFPSGSQTIVPVRAVAVTPSGYTETSTTVTGPLTMWAQSVKVAFQASDLSTVAKTVAKSRSLPMGAKAGIGVGVSLGGLMLVACCIGCFALRRHRLKRNGVPAGSNRQEKADWSKPELDTKTGSNAGELESRSESHECGNPNPELHASHRVEMPPSGLDYPSAVEMP